MFTTRTPNPIFQQLLSDVFAGTKASAEAKASFAPAVDIIESDTAYVLAMDIPGIDPAHIEIGSDKGVLSIKGERVKTLMEGEKSNRAERPVGEFLRKFTLPENINAEQIEASHSFGVLSVRLPKLASSGARRITISG
jgi:HSP20 family protein